MRKLLLTGVFLSLAFVCHAQLFEKALTIELRYPIPMGKNFMNSNLLGGNGYIGIFDAGVEYNVLKFNNLGIGVGLNASLLRLPETEVNVFAIIPGIKINYEIKIGNMSLIPQAGIGYSHWRYKMPDYDGIESKRTDNGLTMGSSIKLLYSTTKQINPFLQIAYEFTRLEKPKDGAENTDFNRNISLLYPGLGIVWKF